MAGQVITGSEQQLPSPGRHAAALIRRAALRKRLDAGLQARLALVTGPAGFGKTTLLADWARACGHPVVVASGGSAPGDVRALLQQLADRTVPVAPDLGARLQARLLGAGTSSPANLATAITEEFRASGADIVVIIDDYYLLEAATRDLGPFMAALLDQLPPNLHLVIGSRTEPALPLARMRAAGDLVEVRVEDLRFTRVEAREFFRSAGISPEQDVRVDQLHDQLEGWPAGIRMASMALGSGLEAGNLAAALATGRRNIRDYLVEEVISQQPPEIQRFLERTSVLGRISVESAAAVLETDDRLAVDALLDQLVRSNLFLQPLDEGDGVWYRYHHLFQQLLQERLRLHAGPDEVTRLDRLAANWFADAGLIQPAIDHWVRAGDPRSATEAIERHLLQLSTPPGQVLLDELLGPLPEAELQRSVPLLLMRAHATMFNGRMREGIAFVQDARSRIPDLPDPVMRREMTAWADGLQADLAMQAGDYETTMALAMPAAEVLAMAHPHIALYVQNVGLIGAVGAGHGDEAADRVIRMGTAVTDDPADPTRLIPAATPATILMMTGHLRQTMVSLQRFASDPQSCPPLCRAAGFRTMGRVQYEWNRLDEAEDAWRFVIERRGSGQFVAYVESLMGMAQLLQARGERDAAQEAALAVETAVLESGAQTFLPWALSFRARIAAMVGDLQSAMHLASLQEVTTTEWSSITVQDSVALSRAWVLAVHGGNPELEEATLLLDRMEDDPAIQNVFQRRLRMLGTRAIVLDARWKTRQAVDLAETALALGDGRGFLRTWVDLGPRFLRLVRLVQGRGSTLAGLQAILDAGEAQWPPDASSSHPGIVSTRIEALTGRELQMLALLDEDRTNQQIADVLFISPLTVKRHLSNLMAKLGVRTRREAILVARQAGLLPRDGA